MFSSFLSSEALAGAGVAVGMAGFSSPGGIELSGGVYAARAAAFDFQMIALVPITSVGAL
jgi:hypothetical protein